ncbi:diiron oxygenase [Spirillospora sp. CA-294931]|uniref:diiron oxygenase n=1 Tax=Spirillospora sp. CA-294931 TaxID=3240042 RepID=UPI003D8A1CE0
MTTDLAADERFKTVLDRLTGLSQRDYYNPYSLFEWPESLPEDAWWMSPELLSVHGTGYGGTLTGEQLRAVSRWESLNFYSLNVHGIRELLTALVARIHTEEFALPSEYFHHVIGEENEHMWFFATFCRRYGRIYPVRTLGLAGPGVPEADHFLVFARLLIFEEIVDVFNQRMGVDERLHPTIRQVNQVHHQDESRHIAFGRQAVALLHSRLRDRLDRSRLDELERYLKRYMRSSVDSLVNPAVFRDAGLPEPYRVRREILADPAHEEYTRRVLRRSVDFMVNEQIFADDGIPPACAN